MSSNLKVIYCDNIWSNIANSENMFEDCISLRGNRQRISKDGIVYDA